MRPDAWLHARNDDEAVFHRNTPLPDVVGRYNGPLWILGSAHCLKDDLKRMPPEGDVLAIKQVGLFYPGFQHWFVSDANHYPLWFEYRRKLEASLGWPGDWLSHARQGVPGVDRNWPIAQRVGRSAGLEATVLALAMGYAPIILAGCPADGTGHFFPESPTRTYVDYGDREHENAWLWLARNVFDDRVKSLSGNTARWLGEP